MPKQTEQKLKILYILQFFLENTDEEHPVSVEEIIAHLSRNGIKAERKSIYSDITALTDAGYDIIYQRSAPKGYFLGARDFELAELKLLVDAVQSSKFITERKSASLISKIEKLASHYQAACLQRQVYVARRVKTNNESVLYNIDFIHNAISSGRKIQFAYSEWNMNKCLVKKNNGKAYEVDPLMLVWDDENYYLVAYEKISDKIKHFRVDKISEINVLDERAVKTVLGQGFDPAEYTKEHFGMFSGEYKTVSVRFEKYLVGVVIDRFGKDVSIIKRDDEHFAARLNVQVSNQFFGWIASFRKSVMIEGPEDVREAYKRFIDDISSSI